MTFEETIRVIVATLLTMDDVMPAELNDILAAARRLGWIG